MENQIKVGDPITNLISAVESYNLSRDSSNKHEYVVMRALREACDAAVEGNYGIGAIIIDSQGRTVARGHNRVFSPHFNSSKHAEMDVIDAYEQLCLTQDRSSEGDILITTLEPCPMCFCRIITSHINTVYFASDDEPGGMVHLKHQLPQVWQDIATGQGLKAQLADCSPELRQLSLDAFLVTKNVLDAKITKSTNDLAPST